LKEAIKGIFVVLITPFNKDGSIDLEGLRTNVCWMLERTVDRQFSINVLGTTGEFYAMSDDECFTVMRTVIEEVNGRLPVFVGTGRAGTRETIKMCQYAESVGADGVQVITPYVVVPQEEAVYEHYKQVAESVRIAVMLYNHPLFTGSWIKPKLVVRLSKIPNIIAVKEGTADLLAYIQEQKAVDPKDMIILCGRGEQMFSHEAVYGCSGLFSYYANFLPNFPYSIYQAAQACDFNKAYELVQTMAPIAEFIGRVTERHGPTTGVIPGNWMIPSIVKPIMDFMGLRGGEVRLPLMSLTKEEKTELRTILKELRLLS